MFYLRKILGWLRENFFKNKELELSIVGLQNAGKSTLINSLQTGEFDEDSIPTVGVNIRAVKKGKVSLKIWDLGGHTRYRETWERYCSTSDCIIFVVDSSDLENIHKAKNELHSLLSHSTLSGIPLLLLGNKNDIKGSLKVNEITEQMELMTLKDRRIGYFSISAKEMVNIDAVLKWLSNLEKLNN